VPYLTADYVKDGKDRETFHANEVVIINYELLDKFYEDIRAVRWQIKIVDEVHKLKNKRANRTLQIFGGIERDKNKKIVARYSPILASKSIYLTGTPSLNGKPKELWSLIQHIDPNGLGADWFAYAKRYCQLEELQRYDATKGKLVHSGWKWDGAENLEELQQRMRSSFMVRRLKADVMKDLPAKRRMILPIESGKKLQKELQKQLEDFEKFAKDRGEDAYLELPSFGDFSSQMKQLGMTMVQPTVEIVEDDMEEFGKVVVMCYHKDVAKEIAAHFPQSVLIDGDVAPTARQELVDRFQNDPRVNPLVGTLGSCSEGLDMTAAKLMDFPERDWVPGKVTQGEDRIHRRGQKESVLYKHLVREGSLAERQVKILVDKQEKSDKMLDRGQNA
jgi:SWI/SNF-related matrix-associated actin-dependent regulator 1 of chromatin subfamily A